VRAEEAARQNSARLLSLYNIREVFGKVWSRMVRGPFEISDGEVLARRATMPAAGR
jgi:hypothetical protein